MSIILSLGAESKAVLEATNIAFVGYQDLHVDFMDVASVLMLFLPFRRVRYTTDGPNECL